MSEPDDAEARYVPVPRPDPNELLEQMVPWKVTLRLIPFLFLLYVTNILDRVNVGFARLQMLTDLQMSEQVYALGSGIFYIGYFAFEIPSNLILQRTGARVWIARILVSWGVISCAMMFVTAPWNFYLLRFLLGLAEAGFFPGIILYLSYWFPARMRARATARFMTAAAVTGIVGGPVSGAILQYLDQVAGFAGWQWLFLLEGLPPIFLGLATYYYLTDEPGQAHWLTSSERDWLVTRMSREEQDRVQHHGYTFGRAVREPRVWLLCLLYSTVAMGSNSFGFYQPKVIADHFAEANKFQIGLLAAVPNLVAIVSMICVGIHSDATGERRWHVALSAFVAAAGWAMIATLETPWLVLIGLALAQAGMLSMLPTFWSLPTSFLSGTAAAGGIAFINSVGNLGGFVGPNVIGQVKEYTGSFSGGFLFMAAAMFSGGLLAIAARHDRSLENN